VTNLVLSLIIQLHLFVQQGAVRCREGRTREQYSGWVHGLDPENIQPPASSGDRYLPLRGPDVLAYTTPSQLIAPGRSAHQGQAECAQSVHTHPVSMYSRINELTYESNNTLGHFYSYREN